MPDAHDRWVALVGEHSAAAGYTLSQAVVAGRLAEYIQDIYTDARERGRSEEEALDAVQQVLAEPTTLISPRAGAPPLRRRGLGRRLCPTGVHRSAASTWTFATRGGACATSFPFSIAVAAILALGIGTATAAYMVLEAVVLRPLPYPHSRSGW